VLADEPTAALDGDNGRAILKILADSAHDGGQAVLVVTHDPRIVPFADRIIHIEDGLLVDRADAEPTRLPKVAPFGPLSA
jgi:putative ABC transport system ATP-binding protein